jgi:diguanylate cyclase (GGDEF)-like protein/PAS domain S-box-containing protein
VQRQTKDGSILDLSISTAPLCNAWGRVEGAVAVYTDLSERKRAEEALQQTSQFNRAVIDHADEAIIVYDRDLRYVLWNRRMECLTGMKAEDVMGKRALDVFPHLRTQGVDRLLGRALAGETVRSEDTLYGTPLTEKTGWVTGSYTPQWDAHGNVVGVIAVLLDVTDRKRAEEELRASEERYRLTFDQAAVGIAHVSPSGHFLQVNEGLCAMLGYTQEELLGARFQDVTHPDDLTRNLAQFEQLLSGQVDSYAINKRFFRKDGSQIWSVARTALVRDASSEPQYTISVIEDMSDRVRAEEALRHQALHDALTGLPNRAMLRDRLDEEIQTARRAHSSFALLLLDLDRFKEINDTFGHHVGDDLLRQVATRLRDVLRDSDTVARLGGDEFALLVPECDAVGGSAVARKVLRTLDQAFMFEGHRLEIGASIGIAIYPEHGEEPATLLQHADVAMYAAKRQHSRHALYLPSEDVHTPNRLAMLMALHGAVRSQQLHFHYQPQVNLRTNQVERVEVLARWVHPEHGFVPPSEFIPMAEQTGLIKPLTIAALNAGLPQCALWHKSGLDVRVAINLSASSLQDPQLSSTVKRLLKRHAVRPEWLEVEVTEGAVMIEPERALRVLGRLHAMGVKIALDDFGTGHSSLGYLKRLPVDVIKIDRSFVRDMATNAEDAAIVQAITNLAHDLGLEVVAEGVEGVETWNLVHQMGCDLVQGFYLSRPLPAEELTWWLDERSDDVVAAGGVEPGSGARLQLVKRQTS